AAHHRLFVMGAESNHQLYVFDVATQSWAVGPNAPYDGGWGSSIEYVSGSDRLYQIDGRDSAGTPQGTAVLPCFRIGYQIQPPSLSPQRPVIRSSIAKSGRKLEQLADLAEIRVLPDRTAEGGGEGRGEGCERPISSEHRHTR